MVHVCEYVISTCTYIYITCVAVHDYVHTYILERERERERQPEIDKHGTATNHSCDILLRSIGNVNNYLYIYNNPPNCIQKCTVQIGVTKGLVVKRARDSVGWAALKHYLHISVTRTPPTPKKYPSQQLPSPLRQEGQQ